MGQNKDKERVETQSKLLKITQQISQQKNREQNTSQLIP